MRKKIKTAREKIFYVKFFHIPEIRIRTLRETDKTTMMSKHTLWEDKILFPFILDNKVNVKVQTNLTSYVFDLPARYKWNGADIPRFAEFLVDISKEDLRVLSASCVHDYLLENKKECFEKFKKHNKYLDMKSYRRLTSLIFRQIIKQDGIKTIKANVMSFCVQIFQQTVMGVSWRI